jgi:hypothetical protein
MVHELCACPKLRVGFKNLIDSAGDREFVTGVQKLAYFKLRLEN